MTSSNFGYGDNYPPVSNRTQTSQSSHQNYPTSNATTAPYYGLQSTEAAAKTYGSNDYQYGQYGQTGVSSNSNLDNWGNCRNTTATGAYSTGSVESVEQRLLNTTRAPTQSNYDSSSLSNLGYGSNLAYGTTADTAQPASDYSSTSLYSGTTQNTTAQRNTQYDQPQTKTRPAATAQRVALPASQGQRQAETTPRTNTTASYNLPTPSPTYPQGLINSYPGNAASASLARGTAASNARVKETTTAQTTGQQSSYSQNTSYGYTQQQARTRLSPEQMRKTQTPTPPVPPIRMATPESRTAASSAQAYYQQSAQNSSTQSASQTRARTQQASSLKTAPVNVIMPSVGQPQTSPKRAPASQRDMYQPQQTSATTVQAKKVGNFWSDPGRASSIYQQQQTQSRSEPAQDQPTSVDPSLVYNQYHEYQQQIKEAEADTARLLTTEEEKKASEEAEKRKAEAAKKEEAEAARIEKQRKQQQAKAAREVEAAEKARQTAGKARKKKEAEEAAAAGKAAVNAARTLAQDMHHQTNSGLNAPQEVQAGEGKESEEYMEAQAGDEQDEDYIDEEQHQQRQPVNFQQQRGTPAHKPIIPPQYQSTPQSRPPQQQNNETPANDADLTAMMEEEMRKTVERLRDFQAKDPKLFLKVWSSVRKSGTGPGQSPQPNGEGSQPQQSAAMGRAATAAQPAVLYGVGPSNQGNTYQNDGSQPQQYTPVPAPKKKRVRKPKQWLEAQTALTQNQENQPQTQEPQSRAQGPQQQQQQFRGSADDFHTGEVLAPGESIMMQTENPQQPLSKNKRGRPSKADKALREMQRANEPPQVKRPPGRPKGSKTKKKLVEGEVVDQAPIAAPPTPPMQPARPDSFGRLVPHAPSATAAQRAAFNEQSQQALQANNAPLKSMGRMLNAAQPSPAVTAAGVNSQSSSQGQGQQSGPSPASRSATMTTIEQAKAAPIGAPAPVQNQTAQWPDEHIDLIADTGSKLLNSLPQNAGKTMESSTIRDMLRTNPSYVQVCEMIESIGFYMDRSKFARTLLAVISPNQSTPATPQGHQPPQTSQAGASSGVSGSQQSIGPQLRNLSSAAAAMRAHKESLLPNISPLPLQQPQQQPQPQPQPAPKSSRPYQVYQPPKYGELGTRPVEEGSFVREDTPQSQGAMQPIQPTMEEKGKSYASPYQQLRPEDSDDYASAPMEEDDRDDEQMLSRLKAFNESQSTQHQIHDSCSREPMTPYGISSGTVPNQAMASGSTQPSAGQPAAQSTYLDNGVYSHLSVNCQNTPSRSISPYLYQSQCSTLNAAASVPQARLGGRPPQLSHTVHSLSNSAPRPWSKPNNALSTGEDSALKIPHCEAFGPNINLLSQPPSSFRPNPFGKRINSVSEMGGARATPFNAGASPFRTTSTTPQLQMPTQASSKSYQALYSQSYLQVNAVEETATTSPHHIARNPLLNFDQIVLPIDTSIARRRNHYNPKTIARDVLLSSGKGPFRTLNAHLEVLKKFKVVDNQSDLSTFRWDIVDPGGDEVGSYNKTLKNKMAAQRKGAVPSRGNPLGMSSRPKTPSKLRDETLKEIEDVDAMDIDDDEQARTQSKRTTPGRPGRQARNPAPSYKGMTAAELKGLKQDAGRRHREGSEQTPSEAAKAPRKGLQYVEFACKWEGCSHVLLNLATLRRHIFTLHGGNDDVVHPGKVCMWHGCGNKDYSAEHDETPGTHFDKLKDFKQHMEDTHLKSVARLYGDGPKSDVYDNDSDFGSSATSSYLFDETGRQVTPSVHAGNGNAGQATVKGNPGFINEARVRKIKREERRKDRILAYWNIENFECQPVRLDGSLSTGGLCREALGRYLRARRQLAEQYGDELAEAVKLNQGMSKANEKRVYAKNMPKELRKKLGV